MGTESRRRTNSTTPGTPNARSAPGASWPCELWQPSWVSSPVWWRSSRWVMAGDIIDGLPEFVFGVVLGVVFGTSFGAAQWRVLRHHLRPAAAWVGATLVGFV